MQPSADSVLSSFVLHSITAEDLTMILVLLSLPTVSKNLRAKKVRK